MLRGSARPEGRYTHRETEEWAMYERSVPQRAVGATNMEAAGCRSDVLGDGALARRGLPDPAGLSRLAGLLVSSLPAPRHEPIATAPRDGRNVEVFLAPDGIWVEACWVPTSQVWVRPDDPERRPLYRVTHWRRPFGSADRGVTPGLRP
jgi:hypothetical protein